MLISVGVVQHINHKDFVKAQVVTTDSWQRIAESLVECVRIVAIIIFFGVGSFLYILFLNILSVFQYLVPLGHKRKDHNFRIHSYIAGLPRESTSLKVNNHANRKYAILMKQLKICRKFGYRHMFYKKFKLLEVLFSSSIIFVV